MDYRHIRLTRDGDVATLVIDRPERMNALATHTLDELIHALDAVQDGGARALLLTGAGRAFCAGADLTPSPDDGDWGDDRGARLETHFNPLAERLRALPMPVVVAVNGAAAGGGCGLALAGDIVIAARSAYFLQAFAAIGLVPDVGSTWRLPRLIGTARATAMMMLGERIPADQAAAWGMIWRVVDDAALTPEATALARRLAAGPTSAYALMKRAIDAGATSTFAESLARERADQRSAGLTDDHREGIAAFLEKRAPRFVGR